MGLSRRAFVVGLVAAGLWAAPGREPSVRAAQSLAANGTSLTVTTSHAVATFAKADLVGFTNVLTGENYLRRASTGELTVVETLPSTGQLLQATNWTVGVEAGTGIPQASITLSDVSRTMTMTVKVDPITEEIVLKTSASTSVAGIARVAWVMAGVDIQGGRLIAPANSGRVFDSKSPGVGVFLPYPGLWHAQMLVYEAAAGSAVIYSPDSQMAFKRLQIGTRGDTTIDVEIGTEATGSFQAATSVPAVEWRLKAVTGDWRAAASIYRSWLNAARPPTSTAGYPWVSNIRGVVTMIPTDPSLLAPLAGVVNPSQTLIYLVQWRSDAYDVDYPDYTPAAGVASFVASAKALGFRVMLHTDLPGVSPGNPDYPGVQAFHARSAFDMQLLGWDWHLPPGSPTRFAYINPAASAFRALWIARVGAAIAAVQPDALHLDISPPFNDGNGVIEGRTYNTGSAKMHEDIQAAFPTIALGGEGETDVTYRYHAFAQVLNGALGAFPAGHPITTYLFSPSVQYYGHLSQPVATDPSFKTAMLEMGERGVLPAIKVTSLVDLDLAQPDNARLAGVLQSWQVHGFQLESNSWSGALVRYAGAASTTAEVTDTGTMRTLTAAGVPLYRIAHDVSLLATSSFVPGWPAFDATTLFGLDPGRSYWLDPVPRPTTTHATSLPDGIRLGSASRVGNGFAHFAPLPVVPPAFHADAQLLQATNGVRFQGSDTPLGNGAVVHPAVIIAGGVSRSGLFLHPPWQGQVGGETFVAYQVAVPAGAVLRFGVGVADNASCTDGVTFEVAVGGSVLWSQHYLKDGWHDHAMSLAAFAGATVPLRIISHPGPSSNAGCDWNVWNDVRIETIPSARTIDVPFALQSGDTFMALAGNGLAIPLSSTSLKVANVPVPGKFTMFTTTGTNVSSGTSLAGLASQTWLEGHQDFAKPGSIFGSGSVGGASAGGVFKNPTIQAHPPEFGRTILSWVIRLPAGNPLRLGWSAGIQDGGATVDGVSFEVRVNGHLFWQLTTSTNQWVPGSLDLAAWQGQTVLLELITDSQQTFNFDWARWADLFFTGSGAACTYFMTGSNAVSAGGTTSTVNLTASTGCPWVALSSAPWLQVTSSHAGTGNTTLNYSVAPNLGAPRSATIAAGGQVFTVTQAAGSTDLVQNGTFASGLGSWTLFATDGTGASNVNFIAATVTNGALEFSRVPPPTGSNSATVFQPTGLAVGNGVALEARFDLGNTSPSRRRISVLVIEHDFSDLSVCTFWLAPNAPMRTYTMRTHTTKAWTNAAIYFYAASADATGGAYRVDNVALYPDAGGSGDRTDCVDPTAPAPVAQADGGELLVNGDFATGTTAGWNLFGQLVPQVAGGVFEFYRPTANPTPAGVILQLTGTALAAGEKLTAQFDLGNSSGVRKRVTVLLHDADFLDLSACTFWLAPGQPLSTYVMRSFTTKAWANATISIYAATVGNEQWTRLDNVSFRKTPSAPIAGTDCYEPGADVNMAPSPSPSPVQFVGAGGLEAAGRGAEARRLRERENRTIESRAALARSTAPPPARAVPEWPSARRSECGRGRCAPPAATQDRARPPARGRPAPVSTDSPVGARG